MKGDPSLEGGYVELHQKELPISIRSESVSFQDTIMVRVFRSTQGFKVELSSQLNVSFFYVLQVGTKELGSIAGEDVTDGASWFRDIFSGTHRYELAVDSPEQAQLRVWAEEKYKDYELAVLPLLLADEATLRRSVMYRYERMCLRDRLLQNHWEGMCAVVRTKNPSLLLQLQHRFKKYAFK